MSCLTLRFPKLVEIANPRLLLLHTALQAVCLVVLLWWFVSAKFWEEEEAIGQHIRTNLWVSSDAGSAAFTERLQHWNASLCSQLDGYKYWWDAAGVWSYSNFTCLLPCESVSGEECISMQEAYSANGMGEVFLVTHRETRTLGPDGVVQRTENAVVLAAEATSIGLSYYYALPAHSWDGSLLRPSRTEPRASSNDLATMLRDASGTVLKTIGPGAEIKLSLPDLLELAGAGLDHHSEAAGTNLAPGSRGEPPRAWLSGLELELKVECYPEDFAGCYLSVARAARGWVYERSFADGRARVQHGVRIVATGGGFHRYFHLTTLLNKLTTSAVLLSVPNKLVCLICITLLGHLSVIYRQAVIDTFSLKDYMAGLSARLMVWNAAFVELVDRHFQSGDAGISKRRMHERLKAALKSHQELDSGEVRQLVDYCFEAISCPADKGRWSTYRRRLTEVTNEIGLDLGSQDSAPVASYLDSDRFSAACTSNEHITFDSVAALFDKERKRRFLERLFTPRHFAEYTWRKEPQDDGVAEDGSSGEDSAGQAPDARPAEESTLQSTATDERSPHVDPQWSMVPRARRSGSSVEEALESGDLRTLEAEKRQSKHLPKRVARLMKEHHFLRDQCKEQLRFQDRVLRGLELSHHELEQSSEQRHRSMELRHLAHSAEQCELRQALRALQGALEERVAVCEEALKANRGRRGGKVREQTLSLPLPAATSEAASPCGSAASPPGQAASSPGAAFTVTSPPVVPAPTAAPAVVPPASPPCLPVVPSWQELFKGTLTSSGRRAANP